MIALAKEPQARFKNIKAFATAFVQAYTAVQHTETAEIWDNASLQHNASEDAQEAHPQKRHSRRTFAIGLSVLGGTGLVVGGTLAWKFLLQRSQAPLHAKRPAQPPHLTPTATPSGPGTTLYTYHGHEGVVVTTLAWSNESMRIASAGDNVQIWDAQTGKLDNVYRNGYDNPSAQVKMAWSPNNRYISAGITTLDNETDLLNAAIYVWEVSTGQVVYTYRQIQQGSQITALAWSPDSTSIATATDAWNQSIQVWKALTGSLVASYTGHTNPVNSLSWSPDGTWIASSDGYVPNRGSGTVHVWEAATGQMSLIYHGHPDPVAAVVWSPNGQLIASAGGTDDRTQASNPDNNTVQIWKPTIDKPVLIYHGHTGPVKAVAWSPTSAFVVSGSSNNYVQNTSALVQVWNATTGQTLLSYMGHNFHSGDRVSAVAWSPDGKLIASAGGVATTVQVWKAV